MIRRIEWEELERDGDGVLEEVADGGSAAITRNDQVIAVLSSPPVAGLPALNLRKARRRGGFESLIGVRSSRPTAELLDRLRSRG